MLNHAKLCENFRRKKKRKNRITRVRDRRRFIRYSASWWKKKKEKRDEKISIELYTFRKEIFFFFFPPLEIKNWTNRNCEYLTSIVQKVYNSLCKACNLSIALGSQRSIIDYFLADRYRRKVGGTIKKKRGGGGGEGGMCDTRCATHWLT